MINIVYKSTQNSLLGYTTDGSSFASGNTVILNNDGITAEFDIVYVLGTVQKRRIMNSNISLWLKPVEE